MRIPFFTQQTQEVQKVNPFSEQAKIEKTYNKVGSKLRATEDFLWEHRAEQVSYEQIAEGVATTENSAKVYVSQLNRFYKCDMTWIPAKEVSEKTGKLRYKKGFIQKSSNNPEEYERWNKKKLKTMTSMDEVVRNGEKNMQKYMQHKKRIKVAVEN